MFFFPQIFCIFRITSVRLDGVPVARVTSDKSNKTRIVWNIIRIGGTYLRVSQGETRIQIRNYDELKRRRMARKKQKCHEETIETLPRGVARD